MTVKITKQFEKQLNSINDDKLKKSLFDLINIAIKSKTILDIPNIKKLKGFKNSYRIRIRQYRIGLYINHDIVEFAAVDLRKDIYKYFPKI